MARVGRALNDRPENPKKWLFIVKQEEDQQTLEKGIACAVTRSVAGERRIFLLTCKEITYQQENLSAHRSKPSFFSKKPNPVEILNSCEDDIYSFTLLENYQKETLPLRSMEEMRDPCHSYIIDGDSFISVPWRYNTEERRHVSQSSTQRDAPRHKVVGSPVLWKDENNCSHVIGVIASPQDGEPLPKFFTESSLQTPGKKKKTIHVIIAREVKLGMYEKLIVLPRSVANLL